MSTWEKAFDTFQWENRSQSTNTPLDATHLNKVNDALDVIDDRVIELQSADADMEEEIAGKQDVLTFDDVPTDGSNNPVKSSGIYDALNSKVDKNGTDRLMTADEGTKLAGIAAGAQVNVLEGVVVDSVEQPISGKKAFINLSGKANLRVIAFPFHDPEPDEPQITFLKGAYVTYNGKLYEITEEHTGAWNPSHAREIDVAEMYVRAGNGGYNNGDCATCEGYFTKASGNYSHAEGRETQAVGECTHAEGRGTIANSIYQHVEGKYNVADNESKYVHIIGNGINDNNRSNAMTLDWDGNLEVSGEVEDGNGEKISDKTDKVTNATSGHLAGLDSNGNLTDSGVSPTEEVTVEGNPVTFDSPFEQDAKSVVVTVKPIQAGSGTPSPENIRPISGIDEVEIEVTGKNLLDINDYSSDSGKVTVNNGLIKINGTFSNRSVVITDSVNISQLNKFIGEQLVFSKINVKGDLEYSNVFFTSTEAWHYWNSNTTIILDRELTNLVIYLDGTYDVEFYLQIELGSTIATDYEPYKGSTTTIPLPSTLYDGKVDVTEGSGTENDGFIEFDGSSDENWSKESGYNLFVIAVSGLPAVSSWGYPIPNWLSNIGIIFAENTDSGAENHTISFGNGYLYVKSDIATVEDFKTWLANNPIQVLYSLATPTTLSFDPTDVELLEGMNVVSTNGEKVAVTYGRSLWQDIADLKTDTEGKLNKSDVADVEGDTASKAYSVNDFMLRADGFYKVTQPIAQNASITASNTTKTTIGAVLTALLNS